MENILHEHKIRTLADLLVDVLRRLRVAHDRIRDLESDLKWATVALQQSIHGMHHVVVERDRLRRSNQRLHEERRQTGRAA